MDHDQHAHHGHMMNHAIPHSMNKTNSHSMHGMAMTFHGGIKEQILFKQWDVNSIGAFIGSWFIIFFVAVLYEGLKTVRDHLARQEIQRQRTDETNQQPPLVNRDDQVNNDLLPRVRTTTVKRARLLSSHHIIQTALHILQMGISYLLMLVAMTFNVYLFLAVILGAGLGHFLFGWRRTTILDYNEHCH